MYTDKKSHGLARIIVLLVLLLWAVILAVMVFSNSRAENISAAEDSIGQAVRRAAMQCYAVEGVYPSSLEYLQENYGLQVNTEDYYVTYDAFASNLMPDIRVVAVNGSR